MKEKELIPKYCSCCGKKMIHSKVSTGFDSYTGNELFGNKWVCPSWRFWGMAIHDKYDDFTSICPY